jgi:AcrR family transcriptional regulator
MGRRAIETRRRLLDATVEQLTSTGLRGIKVIDVARSAGTSPATFYQYFHTVEEAVLVLAEEASEEETTVAYLVAQPWRGAAGLASARQLVDGFIASWDANRAVLRSRNLAAQEGDDRFREARRRWLSKLTDPLAARIAENQTRGQVAAEIHPYAAAAALVSMMERMAAFREDLGVPKDELVETVARIVHQTVTGRKS